MANTFLTWDVVLQEAALQLENCCCLGNRVHRVPDSVYTQDYDVGDTIRVPRPPRYIANDGWDVTALIQDSKSPKVDLTINFHKNVALKLTTHELSLYTDPKKLAKDHLQQAMGVIADQIDLSIASIGHEFYLNAGTAGTPPASIGDIANIGAELDLGSVPSDHRTLVIDPRAHAALISGDLKNLYLQKRVEEQVGKGKIGDVVGFDIYKNQNIQFHQTGTAGGAPAVAAPVAAGGALSLSGLTANDATAFKRGDKFTITGVYAVNYVNKSVLPDLQQFTVLADAASDATGLATLSIFPELQDSTAAGFQTVSAMPSVGALLTIEGTNFMQNLAFHERAIMLAMPPMAKPASAVICKDISHNGFRMMLTQGFDVLTHTEVTRIDAQWGVKVAHPELGGILKG